MKTLLIFIMLILIINGSEKPNILFIMTDQHFADAMSSVIGDEHLKTPHLDGLLNSGIRFDRAYAPNPLCIPARNSIFTGYYPYETELQSNNGKPLKSHMKLMGVHFKEGGYDTGYFGKWHINVKNSDTKRHGFDETGVLRGNGGDHLIPEPAINFLKKDREKPFLLVTSFTSPHDICEMCRGQKIPGGPIGEFPAPDKCPHAPVNFKAARDQTDAMKIMRASYHNTSMTPVGNFTLEKWRQMRWGYYRLIERADREIGKVLKALEDSGKAENTLIVFTADHGDCTGAHGFAQKTVFYDESARIPFIVSFKGKIKSSVSKKLINAGVDTLPTLLDYAGLQIPSQLKGRSVKPIIEDPGSEWREFIVVSNHMVQGGIPPGLMKTRPTPRGRMIRTARFKYSVYDLGDHRESLIDMEKDPHEMINLARQPEYKTILEKHRKLLREFAEEKGDRVALEVIAGDYKELSLKKKKKK